MFSTIARCVFAIVIAVASLPAQAAPARLDEFASADAVLRWINVYRTKPDVADVPVAVKALSRLGALKDPDSAAVYVGFVAGVIGSNAERADELIAKMAVIPPEDQWIIVRAIAYSGLPDWKDVLRRAGERMPTRQVMIEKYLS